MINTLTPADVSHDEMMTWIDAVKRGSGSYAGVARLLQVNAVTLQRWRDHTKRTWPWYYRDIMNGCVGVCAARLRGELSTRRKGSHDWNRSRAQLKSMMRTLDALPPRAFDMIAPAQGDSTAIGGAVRFLQDILDKGPKRIGIIRKRAEHEGIAPITLHRASHKLGVVKKQKGFGAEKVVTWELVDTDD